MIKLYRFEKIKSAKKLENEYKEYLSISIVDKYNYMFSEQHILVLDGTMYSVNNYGRGSITYDIDSIEYRGKTKEGYLIAVDQYISYDYYETDVFLLKSDNGNLKIDSLYKTEKIIRMNTEIQIIIRFII